MKLSRHQSIEQSQQYAKVSQDEAVAALRKLPSAPISSQWKSQRLKGNESPNVAGDYYDDGSVDTADYTVWRDNVGSGALLLNETASLGVVDEDDYTTWKSNYGAANLASGAGATANVPEQYSGTLFLLGCIAAVLQSRLGYDRRAAARTNERMTANVQQLLAKT